MRTILFALVLVLVMAAATVAQTIDGVRLNFYARGGTTVVATTGDLAPSSYVCNLVPPTVTTSVNPTRAVWDDPTNSGRVCIWTDPSPTGPLRGLPAGLYDGKIQAFNAAGRGPESILASFSRAILPPPAPVGLRFAPFE
jgi:hypothetical protein